jgi:peptidoglycan/xylan/chitin deacetylase (PgdA/CDA1 family)
MRFLYVAYCFGNAQGHALVGVYKRGLRVALALARRGHDVIFVCPGRENFHDDTTAEATRRLRFVDFDYRHPTPQAAARNRREFTSRLRALAPDVVVIGEAPLEGFLLEAALGAIEAEIPVAVVDNAYSPSLVQVFWEQWQTMFDGIVVTGPRSFWRPDAPPQVLQIPPFIAPDAAAAGELVRGLGLGGERLVTVLAYDRNVQALALSVARGLDGPAADFVFLTHEVEDCRRQVEALPAEVRRRVRVLPPQPDGLHFGLLQLARLAIGKCAFMQVTECLSLHTPIVGYEFAGQFSLRMLPPVCRRFSHSTRQTVAGAETLAVARHLLDVPPDEMRSVHDGSLGAAEKAAGFLEALPGAPRERVGEAAEATLRRYVEGISPWGAAAEPAAPNGHRLTDDLIRSAVAAARPGVEVEPGELRFGRIRDDRARLEEVLAATARYSAGGAPQLERWWVRVFRSDERLEQSARRARDPGSERRLRLVRREQLFLVEEDRGEALLPTLDELAREAAALLPRVPVLAYHHVHDGEDSFFRTWPEAFRRQMELLLEQGWVPTTPDRLARLAGADAADERLVLVTFDDAYEDFADHAWPVLESLGIPATVFAIADAIGGWNDWDELAPSRHRHLDAAELRRLHAAGVTIGSHTCSHRPLVRLSQAELDRELGDSRRRLEDLLGAAVTTFAYPGGVAGERERLAARRWYELAFAFGPGAPGRHDDPHLVPRFDPCFHQGPEDFLEQLERHAGPAGGRRRAI